MTYWVITPLIGKTSRVNTVIVKQRVKPRFGSKQVRYVREGDLSGFETFEEVMDYLDRCKVPNEMRPVEFWQ